MSENLKGIISELKRMRRITLTTKKISPLKLRVHLERVITSLNKIIGEEEQ